MKHEEMLGKAFSGVVVFAIASILAVAIFFVYRTFERSVQADIFSYTRDMEDSIRRIASAEYRRYFLLADVGRSFGHEAEPDILVAQLEREAEIFGPEGDIPHLVSSIGYYDIHTPDQAYEYEFTADSWKEINNVFNVDPLEHGFSYFYTGTESKPGELYFAITNRGGAFVIFFRLDRNSFVDKYVKPVVETINTDFTFGWYSASTSNTIRKEFEAQFKRGPGVYQFLPLRILSGAEMDKIPLIVEIPGFFDVRKIIESDLSVPDDKIELKPERSMFMNSGIFVKILHTGGSYYYEIEHKAAVNFMETIIIFLIIGILFMMLLFQLQRMRVLRRKEKKFVASITHELRTPLTVIRSAADNLRTGIISSEKLPVYGGLITEQSERLGNMIEEILLYSNFEHKKRRPEVPVAISFDDLVRQLKLSLNSLAAFWDLVLKWDTDGLPENAESYPDVITLAVNNLVANAVYHAYADKKGEIRIRFRYLITQKIQITIEDDGRGIESREHKKIFEPFYRDKVSRSRQEHGSGLGLFNTKRKADLVGGGLTVDSPYRRIDGSKLSGCRFTLTLPCSVPADEHEVNKFRSGKE